MNSRPAFSLRLFGSPGIAGGDGALLSGRAAQRHRLALLALLALSPERRASREKLLAYLWPESETERARNRLNVSVYVLRRVLGEDALLSSGDELRLNPVVLGADVAEFQDALARGEHERATALYAGPFLDGFFLSGAPELERWIERERERLAGAHAKALEALAEAAEGERAFGRAAEWWRARAAHDPYDSRIALRLMRALDAGGNRAGALQHAAIHQRLLQEEFGVDAAPEVPELAERLRAGPGVRVEPGWGRPASPAPTLSEAGTATVSTAGAAPAPPPPLIAAPAARRLRPLAQYTVAAVVLGAVLFGTLQLARTRNGAQQPAASEPSTAVLGLRPDRDPGTPVHRRQTQNVAAHELYLRGTDPALLRSGSAAREGLEYFRQAVALDSTYAAAWAGLGRMYGRVASAAPVRDRARYREFAEVAARRAVALDDSLAEAHATLGLTPMAAFDFVAAERHLRRAAELDPSDALTHEWMVTLHLWTGRPADALAHAERALELDPLSPSSLVGSPGSPAHLMLTGPLLEELRRDPRFARLREHLGLPSA